MASQEKTNSKTPKFRLTSQKDIDIIDNEIKTLQYGLDDFPPSTPEEVEKIKYIIDQKIQRKKELEEKINYPVTIGFHVKTESSGKHRKRKITKKRKHKKRKTKKRKPKNKRKTKKR